MHSHFGKECDRSLKLPIKIKYKKHLWTIRVKTRNLFFLEGSEGIVKSDFSELWK
jgi:hypothetical protein